MSDVDRISRVLATARRITIGVVIASVAGLAIGLVMLILADRPDDDGIGVRMISTCMVLLFFSIIILAVLITARERKYRAYALVTAGLALVSALCWMIIIWRSWAGADWDDLCRVALTMSLVTLTLTLEGSLRLLQTRFLVLRLARWGVLGLLVADVVVICGLVWEVLPMSTSQWGWTPSWWFMGVALPLSLLSLVGLIVVPLVIRLVEKRIIVTAESIPMKLTLQLNCPKCGVEQTASNGPARCTECGFRMMIEVEEPRCECGYLLYRLSGLVCPECGRSITENQKWMDSLPSAEPTSSEDDKSDGSPQPLRSDEGITTDPVEETEDE